MQFLIERASTYAAEIDNLILLIAILVGFWFFLAEGVFFYFIFKYRRKEGVKAGYVTGEKKEEMKWIHWPHNLVLVCDVLIIVFAIKAWYTVKQQLPEPEAFVKVIGQQWAWTFVHAGPDGKLDTEDDIFTADELHLEVDKTYHYYLESKDVLHSFSVPVFRLKQDAIPGRVITGWFKATKTGVFDVQCTEMCGIGHGLMAARTIIHSSDEYQQWMTAGASIPAGTRVALGEGESKKP